MEYQNVLSETEIDPIDHITITEKITSGKSTVHFHNFFELEIILDGSGKQMMNGLEYDLKRGSVHLLTPADFHQVLSFPFLKLINVQFDESVVSKPLLTALFGKPQNLCFVLPEEELETVCLLAKQLILGKNSRDAYTSLYFSSILNCILVKIIRCTGNTKNPGGGSRNTLMNDAMRYLYTHFRDNPSLSQLSAICGYSPNYFSKLFIELTGKGYSDFLNALKVTHAKMLLTSTDKTVSEIAFFCGFNSLSNFYRVFRDMIGMAPIEYREQVKTTEGIASY